MSTGLGRSFLQPALASLPRRLPFHPAPPQTWWSVPFSSRLLSSGTHAPPSSRPGRLSSSGTLSSFSPVPHASAPRSCCVPSAAARPLYFASSFLTLGGCCLRPGRWARPPATHSARCGPVPSSRAFPSFPRPFVTQERAGIPAHAPALHERAGALSCGHGGRLPPPEVPARGAVRSPPPGGPGARGTSARVRKRVG